MHNFEGRDLKIALPSISKWAWLQNVSEDAPQTLFNLSQLHFKVLPLSYHLKKSPMIRFVIVLCFADTRRSFLHRNCPFILSEIDHDKVIKRAESKWKVSLSWDHKYTKDYIWIGQSSTDNKIFLYFLPSP